MDPFDSMLRYRFARVISAAPSGLPPTLPPSAPERPPFGVDRPRWRRSHPRARGAGLERSDTERRPIGSVLTGLAALLLVVVAIGGVAWLLATPRTVPAGAGPTDGPRTVWDSGPVRLSFDTLRVVTGGKVFTASGITPTSITSDSGNRYRTLEVVWQEQGVEMRLNIYFAADDTEWWATEVRVYDGREEGDWIGWGGSTFSTSRDDQRPRPSGDLESRLRAFGVPADAEGVGWSMSDRYLTSVVYRDRRGQFVTIGCDRRTSMVPGDPSDLENWTWKQAPAEACGPPPVDLGLFRSHRGEAWSGDLDLLDGVGRANGEGAVSGELHIHGLRVSAFQ